MRLPKRSSSCIAILFLLVLHGGSSCILVLLGFSSHHHVSALVVVASLNKSVGQKTTKKKPYYTRRLERRLVLDSQCQDSGITFAKNNSIPRRTMVLLTSSLLWSGMMWTVSEPHPVVMAAVAPTPPPASTGILCATQHCQRQLATCMKDSSCAPGLGCPLLRCQLQQQQQQQQQPNSSSEGNCQVRCVDLYENEAMQALTDCTLTE
jgi:hypothetical protein